MSEDQNGKSRETFIKYSLRKIIERKNIKGGLKATLTSNSSFFLSVSPPAREGCRRPLHHLHGVQLHHHPGPARLPQRSHLLFRLRLLVAQRLRAGRQRSVRAWRTGGAVRRPGEQGGVAVVRAQNAWPPATENTTQRTVDSVDVHVFNVEIWALWLLS